MRYIVHGRVGLIRFYVRNFYPYFRMIIQIIPQCKSTCFLRSFHYVDLSGVIDIRD